LFSARTSGSRESRDCGFRRRDELAITNNKADGMKHNKKSKTTISPKFNGASASAGGVTIPLNAYRVGIYRPAQQGPKPAKKPGVSCPTSKQPYVLNVRWLNNSAETRPIVRWKAEIAHLSPKSFKITVVGANSHKSHAGSMTLSSHNARRLQSFLTNPNR
jgi:hypothetical protein